jgi:ubiquinone/menaquinone biosynthesis C-methylase UbiE
MEKYLQSCKSEFWKEVFRAELKYVSYQLRNAKDVLSVGCGPAIIEAGLAENGFNVTGLDVSEEALRQAPESVRTVTGSADNMGFANESFDAVIYVASLQFIENYKQAVKEGTRVLKSGGKILIMLLNPRSEFFKKKVENPDSYINGIKHSDLKKIENEVAEFFAVETEYFLGIRNGKIFDSNNCDSASLYVIKGIKK